MEHDWAPKADAVSTIRVNGETRQIEGVERPLRLPIRNEGTDPIRFLMTNGSTFVLQPGESTNMRVATGPSGATVFVEAEWIGSE